MSFPANALPEFVAAQSGPITQPGMANNTASVGKTTAGHQVLVMDRSSTETTAKTDKVAAERREELVKNTCTCNVDCCCCHGWISGLPATIACTVLCFWNPIAWCCLVPAWKEECCS